MAFLISISIPVLTTILVLVSVFLVLIILMQRASSNAGMGATLGGGAAESALGADTGNVLSRGTIYGAIIFFFLTFALYLGNLYVYKHSAKADQSNPLEMIAEEKAQQTGTESATTEKPAENVTPPEKTQEGENK